ncbi:MAG: ABC transporter permease [Phycisphaerales bacterium]
MSDPQDHHLEPPDAGPPGESLPEHAEIEALREEILAHDAMDVPGVTFHERESLTPDLLARRFGSDSRSYWQIVAEDFRKNKVAMFGLYVMAFMALLGVLAPYLANHRPFLMVDDDAVSFPLFRMLTATDIVLIFLVLFLVLGRGIYKASLRNKGNAAGGRVLVLLALCLIMPIVGLVTAIQDRIPDWSVHDPGAVWWWVRVVGAGGIGIVLAFISFARLFTNPRDAFGRAMTGTSTVTAIAASILLSISGATLFVTSQPGAEQTDYYAKSLEESTWAIFAPIPHDYIRVQSFMINQPPGAPFVRVQNSGGSRGAADIGLTDVRRKADLAQENTAQASKDNRVPLSRDTLLADLRSGEGVRSHGTPTTDFTVVSHSMETFAVSFDGLTTLGEVLDAINAASHGTITATIDRKGERIIFEDTNRSKPIHLAGTDTNGSDVAARIIHATRVALSIGFVSTSIALFIGITVGALMGYFGGWVDIIGMRTIEIFMAIPRLFLLLTIIAFIPPEYNEYMLYAMMAVIGATSWMGGARFIRAEFLRLRHQDFVQSARAVGLPLRSILFKHMLPNGVTPVLVDASFSVAAAILLETGLSFLGFGIKPPEPSWGQMLAGAVDPSTGVFRWWLAIFPGVMIFLTVFAFNVVGDALRDAVDPKLKKA